jgi:ligand-binding sensor domain-containing protein
MIRILLFLLLFTQPSQLTAQPDSRFRPFDWTLYRGSGSITSITEGFTFAYIGTEMGGLKRFNIFSQNFDEPITIAQGLKDNNITATHFDMKTGLIWAASSNHIQYSFSREGDWYAQNLQNLGLSRNDLINRIGSSENFLWLQARSSYVKLDHSSGTLIGIYPVPDELNIEWSSGRYIGQSDLHELFMTYSVMAGWILNGDELIDDLGRRIDISTGLIGRNGNVYAGAEDGTFFQGTTTMETFYPLYPDISNTDVLAIFDDGEDFWIGSSDYISSKGISRLNPQTIESDIYQFDGTINMQPTSIYSIHVSDNELWAGGNEMMLVFDMKKNYWRTLDETRGIPSGAIWDIYGDSNYVWVGSSAGLSRIDKSIRREAPIGIEPLFNNIPVYDIEGIDNDIWIGSRSGLFVFNRINPQIRQAKDIGRKDFPEMMVRITAIKEYDGVIFVAGEMGIAKFRLDTQEWNLVYPSTLYHGNTVYSMAVNRKFLFLGTKDGLVRINKKTGFYRDYSYDFIGQVNDIKLDGNVVWLGTSRGLIKFKWKRDS